MKVATTVKRLCDVVAAASEAVPPGVCRKCWSIEFHRAVFGVNGETYTYPTKDGTWFIDADRANQICGGRIDAYIPPQAVATGSGEREGTHELCLLRRLDETKGDPKEVSVNLAARGKAAGIITEVGGVAILIDGTHRGRLAAAAGVNFPVSLLLPHEFEQCVIMRPGDDVAAAADREADRVERMARSMNGDELVARCVNLLGPDKTRRLLLGVA